jgi:cell division protein FtsZ
VESPLLEHSISGASRILLNITGGPDLTLYEVSEIAEYVTQAASPDANIIFGHVVHPHPEVEVRVTLIATGMPDQVAQGPVRSPYVARPASYSRPPEAARPAPPARDTRDWREPAPDTQRRTDSPTDAGRVTGETDPLDVPPFLRKPR